MRAGEHKGGPVAARDAASQGHAARLIRRLDPAHLLQRQAGEDEVASGSQRPCKARREGHQRSRQNVREDQVVGAATCDARMAEARRHETADLRLHPVQRGIGNRHFHGLGIDIAGQRRAPGGLGGSNGENAGAAANVENVGRRAPLQDVILFDEYRGKGLENKEKSLAFRFRMQDTRMTLSDAQADAAMAAVAARLAASHGARLRSA